MKRAEDPYCNPGAYMSPIITQCVVIVLNKLSMVRVDYQIHSVKHKNIKCLIGNY